METLSNIRLETHLGMAITARVRFPKDTPIQTVEQLWEIVEEGRYRFELQEDEGPFLQLVCLHVSAGTVIADQQVSILCPAVEFKQPLIQLVDAAHKAIFGGK